MNDTQLHLLHHPPTCRRFFFQSNYSVDWCRLLPLRIVYVFMSIVAGCAGLVWFLRLSSEVRMGSFEQAITASSYIWRRPSIRMKGLGAGTAGFVVQRTRG
jgi:hypothetical protein